MMKTLLAMYNFPTALQILIPIVMISFISSETCQTEVDILWEKYGDLKADIERLKARSQICDGSCTPPSTTKPEIVSHTPTTPITTTISNEGEMINFGFELLSVTKQVNPASNETELTVTMFAPDDVVCYWFESMSQFIPAYEDGEFATVARRGDLTQVKLKKYLRYNRHFLTCLSKFTGISVAINVESNKQAFSSSGQNCKYSNVKSWETQSTFNSNITFQCNTLLNNLTIKSRSQFLYQMEKDSKSAEIIQTLPDSTDFNISQTEENDESVSVVFTVSKEKYGDYYIWVDYGMFASTNDNELVEEIDFFVFANKTMNGGMHPLLPPGRIGFYTTQNFVFIEGEDGYIPCFAIGNQAPGLRIAKRDIEYGDTHLTTRGQYKAFGELGYTWTKLTSVSQTDAGEYCCIAYLNETTASMNFSVSIRPKNYTFYVKEISKNMTSDGMINATFQALGYTDINVTCNFDSIQYNPGMNMELNDTVTTRKISATQVLLTYTALVDPVVVSMRTNGIECYVIDAFNRKYVFIDLYTVLY